MQTQIGSFYPRGAYVVTLANISNLVIKFTKVLYPCPYVRFIYITFRVSFAVADFIVGLKAERTKRRGVESTKQALLGIVGFPSYPLRIKSFAEWVIFAGDNGSFVLQQEIAGGTKSCTGVVEGHALDLV